MILRCHPERAQRVEGPLFPQKSRSDHLVQMQNCDCWQPKGSFDSSLRSSLRMTRPSINNPAEGAPFKA